MLLILRCQFLGKFYTQEEKCLKELRVIKFLSRDINLTSSNYFCIKTALSLEWNWILLYNQLMVKMWLHWFLKWWTMLLCQMQIGAFAIFEYLKNDNKAIQVMKDILKDDLIPNIVKGRK
jgi:hypothetical protein